MWCYLFSILLFVLWLHFTKLIVLCVILSDHELGLGPDFEYGHREQIILYPERQNFSTPAAVKSISI